MGQGRPRDCKIDQRVVADGAGARGTGQREPAIYGVKGKWAYSLPNQSPPASVLRPEPRRNLAHEQAQAFHGGFLRHRTQPNGKLP
jgi:hypothetical protein